MRHPPPPRDMTEESPRVRGDFPTFKEWEEKAEPYFQCSYSHGRSQRACYDIMGQSLFMEANLPWLKQITTVYKATDFNITADSDTMKLAAEFGGEWEEGYYADPGYGWPVFAEAEDCWKFIKKWRAKNEDHES